MRHVSRPDRVALDCLFDWIFLDSKIQIRYIDTRHQLADIFTKGNFTRDEWNNLLHLFNISHFSSTYCAKNSSLIRCTKTMAKRMQEQKGEEKLCNIEIYEVFHSSTNPLNNTKDEVKVKLSRDTASNKHTQKQTKPGFQQHDNFDLNNVDCVRSNAKFPRFGAMLYIFEDTDAVIKMITQGRVRQCDMFPEPTELLWNGCLTEFTWTLRSKSGTLTPNNRLLTY